MALLVLKGVCHGATDGMGGWVVFILINTRNSCYFVSGLYYGSVLFLD